MLLARRHSIVAGGTSPIDEVIARYTGLTATEETALRTYIQAEIDAGNWDKMDDAWCGALFLRANKLIGMKGSVATGTFTSHPAGFQTDGLADYWNCGYSPLNNGVNWKNGDAQLSMWFYKMSTNGVTYEFYSRDNFDTGLYQHASFGKDIGLYQFETNGSNVETALFDNKTMVSLTQEGLTDKAGLRINGNLQGGYGPQDADGVVIGNNLCFGADQTNNSSRNNFKDQIISFVSVGAGIGFDYTQHNLNVRQLLEDLGVDTFRPNLIGNMYNWLDSSVEKSISISSGTSVASWKGRSGGTWSQDNASYQPQHNGPKDGILFQEAQNFLYSSSGNYSQEYTSIIVSKTVDQHHQDPNIFIDQNMKTEERWDNGTTTTATRYGVRANNTWNFGNTFTPLGQMKMDAVVRSNGGATATFYKNGVEDGSFSVTGGWEVENSTRWFGGRYSSTDYHGHVYEILTFHKALTQEEITQVWNYLNKKWGIIVSAMEPAVWLDSDDENTILYGINDQYVERWWDKTGNLMNANELTVADQPRKNTNGIDCPTRYQHMIIQRSIIPDMLDGATDYELFIVGKAGDASRRFLVFESRAIDLSAGVLTNAGGDTNIAFDESLTSGFHLLDIVIDETNDQRRLTQDNYATKTDTLTKHTHTLPRIYMSDHMDIADYGCEGKFKEIILFPRILTSGERDIVRDYLLSKWNI